MGTDNQQHTPPADASANAPTSDTHDIPDEQALALFTAEANELIRKVWLDGRWWYSVIDAVALLSESASPRVYWAKLKERVKNEGFVEVLTKCRPLKLPAPDGKLRETDCADFATLISLIHTVPALHRRADFDSFDQIIASGQCGIYAIVNTITHEHYVGSSTDMTVRFAQHKALLRRGKHHASRLQVAWDTYGEETFVFVVRETLTTAEQLEDREQWYLDAEQPVYNAANVARNRLWLSPVADARVQQVLLSLYEIQYSIANTPLFRVLRDALISGIIKPGPNFALLAQAEASGIDTWEGLSTFVQQYQQVR